MDDISKLLISPDFKRVPVYVIVFGAFRTSSSGFSEYWMQSIIRSYALVAVGFIFKQCSVEAAWLDFLRSIWSFSLFGLLIWPAEDKGDETAIRVNTEFYTGILNDYTSFAI